MNLSKISKTFRYVQSRNPRSIKKLCQKTECISFDMFDTLIYRRVASAEKIFRLMEERLELPGFCEKRRAADRTLRQTLDPAREDVSLKEIYDYFEGITEEDRIRFAQMECDLEVEQCNPRPDMKEIFEECIRLKKDIYIISDMYLPRSCLVRMLEKCGYRDYKALFISCEEEKLKLTGNLFRVVLQRTGISAGSLVHIGDNMVSDYLRARQLGIKSVKIRQTSDADRQRWA